MKFLDRILLWLGSHWPGRYFVSRFVAGDTMENAFRVAQELNSQGFEAIINFLGEEVKDKTQVWDNVNVYAALMRGINQQKLKARISVKPSQLGLKIASDLYRQQLRWVGRDAFLNDIPLEIDIETEDAAGEIIQETINLVKYFPKLNLRQAMAMNFKDSFIHLYNLTSVGVKVRLCKGAYSSKYSEKKIAKKFYFAASWLLRMKANQDFATHDLGLIKHILSLKNEYPSPCGFQFLLGLRKRTWKQLAEKKERVAIYVPFGSHWLPYAKRRWTYIIKKIPSMICDEIAKK